MLISHGSPSGRRRIVLPWATKRVVCFCIFGDDIISYDQAAQYFLVESIALAVNTSTGTPKAPSYFSSVIDQSLIPSKNDLIFGALLFLVSAAIVSLVFRRYNGAIKHPSKEKENRSKRD